MRRAGLIFDLDGTLIDSALAILAIINIMRDARHALPLQLEDIRPHLSKGGLALVQASLAEVAEDPEADLALFREHYAVLQQGPEIIFAEVERALRAVRLLGIPMAVCTNKPTLLTARALVQTGLDRYFDGVVAYEAGKPTKPDPAPLYEACRHLDVHPAASIMIGDSEADAEAAHAAGLRFVFACYGYPVGNPAAISRDFTITCPSELPSVLSAALASARSQAAA